MAATAMLSLSPRLRRAHARAAIPADRFELQSLIGELMPGCDVRARWRWLYETNPAGRALTWLAVAEDGVIAGCTSFFPQRMWLDGAEVIGALAGDGYVRPEYRRRGLGGLMHDESRRQMAALRIGCMYAAPGAMNLTPLKHGGSRELGRVARWARPLGGRVLGVESPLFDRAIAEALRPRLRTAELSPMQRHDPRVDDVWAEARRELALSAVRDAAFYTWRFLELPGRAARPYVIADRGAPIGACALELSSDRRTMRIVDLLAVPGAWHAALRAIARFAAETSPAQLLDIKLMAADGRRRAMWRSGFVEREQKPFLCMIPRAGDRRFLDAQRWFYTGADSDLERQV